MLSYADLVNQSHLQLCRRLESLENQTERLGRAISDARDVDCVREEGLKERFNSLDKGLRDISRGVQLVRDKQVSTCHSKGLSLRGLSLMEDLSDGNPSVCPLLLTPFYDGCAAGAD